jgi:hypothetical protein
MVPGVPAGEKTPEFRAPGDHLTPGLGKKHDQSPNASHLRHPCQYGVPCLRQIKFIHGVLW